MTGCSENQEKFHGTWEQGLPQNHEIQKQEETQESSIMEFPECEDQNNTIVQWICHTLIKLKLSYNSSNALFSLIITVINFNLALVKHPLHLPFPKTLNDLLLISN